MEETSRLRDVREMVREAIERLAATLAESRRLVEQSRRGRARRESTQAARRGGEGQSGAT